MRALLPHHDVYITDWTDARMVPLSAGPFHLHDYIYYVQDFIRQLGPDLHVISVCQPTVPVLAAISLMASANDPKLPKTMTMMGGPIDPRKSPTPVNDLATEKPLFLVREQRDLQRAAELSRASAARCIRASCSMPASSP